MKPIHPPCQNSGDLEILSPPRRLPSKITDIERIPRSVWRHREANFVNTQLDPTSYNVNRQAVPIDDLIKESQEQGGRLVARSTNGVETYVYADCYQEIYQLLDQRGIQPHQAVVARVPVLNEGEMF